MTDKLKFHRIITPNLSEDDINEYTKLAETGNIQSRLTLIMHNQAIINEKLNRLLEPSNKPTRRAA